MAAPRSAHAKSVKTTLARETILDTAERLFAERGAKAVSMREINAEAGYSPTALYYHFKTREALIKGVLARRRPAIMERRAEMLTRLSINKRPTLEDIADVLVRPLAVPLLKDPVGGTLTLRVLARLHFERDKLTSGSEEGLKLFLPHLKKALPRVSESVLTQRWLLASELAVQSLANIGNLNVVLAHKQTPEAIETFLTALIKFIAGGLSGAEGSP